MPDVRILIADDDSDFAYLLELSLNAIRGCRVVGTVADGLCAIEWVKHKTPDVVIVDIVLPRVDGFGVLEAISRLEDRPAVFVVSAIQSREISDKAMKLGALHYFVKPVDTEVLARMIRHIFGLSATVDSKVLQLLHMLKIPPDLKGVKYLKEIIAAYITENEDDIRSIIRSVADLNGVKPERVQRSVRYAIQVAWDLSNVNAGPLSFLFSPTREAYGKPTIAQFVRMAAAKIKQY